MRDEAGVGVHPGDWMATEMADPARRKIFFLASRGAVFQGLFQAVRDHFPAFDVTLVDQLPPGDDSDDAVRLVLLGLGKGWNLSSYAFKCRHRFPAAAIGLIVEDSTQETGDYGAFLDGRVVQGFLPLTLPLDVWLAVMSLLISGGRYIPAEMTRASRPGGRPVHEQGWGARVRPSPINPHRLRAESHRRPAVVDRPAPPAASRDLGTLAGSTRSSAIDTLTARERQILKLVSEGFQNKLIADRMALSEHTVKAHVHNLIAKLRVSNRTQAAAAFLRDHEVVQFRPGDDRSASYYES